MTIRTIEIKPNLNVPAIEAYAEQHQTRDPQSHLTGAIEALAELADFINENELEGKLVNEVRRRHSEISNEFLEWFRGPNRAA